jgi:antitoxin component YwqK of YwqJK toxin-antitoxin module
MEEEDTSDGDFYCPIPIPKEATHRVTDYSDCWVTPNGFVGPRYFWYDKEKTKKYRFQCFNIEGELYGVSNTWHEDGTLYIEKNYKDGKRHGVTKWWYDDGRLYFEDNYKDGKKHGVCKTWSDNGKLIRECNYEEGKCVSCVHGHC